MNGISSLLQNTGHRPWPIPEGEWSYYQEWNNVLFLHWKVPYEELIKLVPEDIPLDIFESNCWVSLVAFTMQKIRTRKLPSFYPISNFHEINVRTYVKHDNKAGVYFLSIEAEKVASSFIARLLSGLPYEKANISRIQTKNTQQYSSVNKQKGFKLDAKYLVAETLVAKSALDKWLTERYCLYQEHGLNTYRFDIHHNPWPLNSVKVSDLNTCYKIGNISLTRKPDLMHYSTGVKVVSWNRKLLK